MIEGIPYFREVKCGRVREVSETRTTGVNGNVVELGSVLIGGWSGWGVLGG